MESTQWQRFFGLVPNEITQGHRNTLFKKREGAKRAK